MTLAIKFIYSALFTLCASGIAYILPMPTNPELDRPVSPITVYEATPAPTTTMPALVTTCTQVAVLALAEGLPRKQLKTALKVAVRESLCTSDAFNATDVNGGSRGIYQVNGYWCRPNQYWPNGWLQAKGVLRSCKQLFDPVINTRAMIAIWRNSGWLPWSTSN